MAGRTVAVDSGTNQEKILMDWSRQAEKAGLKPVNGLVKPLATGGTTAHVLAIDYALRPVLSSMGATHITPGWFTLDKDLTVAPGAAEALAHVTDQFSLALGGRPALLAAAG